jgi:hypothetical protein
MTDIAGESALPQYLLTRDRRCSRFSMEGTRASLSTTQRYIQGDTAANRGAVDLCPPATWGFGRGGSHEGTAPPIGHVH